MLARAIIEFDGTSSMERVRRNAFVESRDREWSAEWRRALGREIFARALDGRLVRRYD